MLVLTQRWSGNGCSRGSKLAQGRVIIMRTFQPLPTTEVLSLTQIPSRNSCSHCFSPIAHEKMIITNHYLVSSKMTTIQKILNVCQHIEELEPSYLGNVNINGEAFFKNSLESSQIIKHNFCMIKQSTVRSILYIQEN